MKAEIKGGYKKGSLVIESGIPGAGPKVKFSEIHTHGGPRKGAGRKAGSGKGRTYVSKTVAMQPESWRKLDLQRGTMSRGKFIESKL